MRNFNRVSSQKAIEANPERGDDQDVPDACVHQNGHGVVDHGLVINEKELLGSHIRQELQPGTGTTGQNNTFHISVSLSSIRKLIQNTLRAQSE